jgi:hypothetical protein
MIPDDVSEWTYSAVEEIDLTQRCAEYIRTYWIQRGYHSVTAQVVNDNGRNVVMSNLVNGLPPGARREHVVQAAATALR